VVELVLLVLGAGAVGAVAWGADKNRQAYGALVPAAAGIVAAVLLWLILMALGLGSEPGIYFLSWLLPLAASIPAAGLTAWFVGRRRTAADLLRLESALRS
jgi:Zn-dependent protease with chaperone function